VLLLPILVLLNALVRSVHATIDVTRGEVLLVHRILGIRTSRTWVPLEIAGAFFVDYVGGSRSRTPYLAVEVVTPGERRRRHRPSADQRVLLCTGDRVEEAAAALNRALGREGWSEES
jgi:hypothetical protein